MKSINQLIIIFISLALCSCSVFSPVKVEPVTKYVLSSVPQPPIKKSYRKLNLLVTPITSNPLYNTTGMAYKIKPYQINYFAKSQWAETPAAMLQPLVIQTLQKTHYFNAINAAPALGYYDFILNIQLIELQQEFLPHSSFVRLTLRVQFINIKTNRVVASKQFSVTEFAPQNTPYGGVIAANRAVAIVLKKISATGTHVT